MLVMAIYCMLFASRFIDVSKMGTGSGLFLSIIAIQLVVLMFPGVFYCRLKDSTYSTRLNLKLFSPGYLGFIFFTALSLIAATALIRCGQVYIFNLRNAAYIPYASDFSFNVDMTSITYAIITFAVIPSIAEEFIFRSVLLRDYQEEKTSDIAAILATSVLFAMLYFDIAQFPVYLLAGITFSFVTYITRSAIASMVTHFLFSIYSLFLDKYIVNIISKPDNIVFFVFASVILLLIFAIITFSEAERITRHNSASDVETPVHVKNRTETQKWYKSAETLLTSPTYLFCIVIFAIFAVFSA